MEKVMIIGCPGSGKSVFARKLREKTGLPLFYLDRIWHKSDKTTVTQEEFDAQLAGILKREKWIIDGNYSRTMEIRLKACDTVFLFDLPVAVCLDGAKSRIGIRREDMPWVEEALDDEFRQWIADFPQNALPQIYDLLGQYKADKNIVIFKSRKESDDYIQMLSVAVCPLNSLTKLS